ncbi:MAG: sulfotransferase [Actinomycetota bacterium]|nr:sulfotransferase [Actinomycetota bacterium]
MSLPDFFVVGVPKGGTTALHALLAQHPGIYLSPVKEPKFYLCAGGPPPRSTQRGPGDAHSAREWMWRRARYEALFEAAPPGVPRGESTPFYLYDRTAHARMAHDVPDAKIIAVLRDPVDRAYSNWNHLRADGLEPVPDFLAALALEDERVARGWAPFWHYRRLGRYAEQLRSLYAHFPRDQVLLLRYRELVDEPVATLTRVDQFLGVAQQDARVVKPENVHPYVGDSARVRALGGVVRAGAQLGSFLAPQVWRAVDGPLLKALHRNGTRRPRLTAEQRAVALEGLADDIRELEQVTGRSYGDWLGLTGAGDFVRRHLPNQRTELRHDA